jgi:hypothetical protein
LINFYFPGTISKCWPYVFLSIFLFPHHQRNQNGKNFLGVYVSAQQITICRTITVRRRTF